MTRTIRLGVAGLLLGAGLVVVAALVTASAGRDGGAPTALAGATSPPRESSAHRHPPEPPAEAVTEQAAQARVTPAQRLLRRTRRHVPRWADVADAEAAGYRSIGDAVTGYEHFIQPAWVADTTVLDPRRPESLVYRVRQGKRRLVSAMYILPPGSTMSDVPDLGDDRARWHLHDDLCWDEQGRVAGVHRGGRCVPGGTLVVTPPMLHVWLTDHPCGPFAGLQGHGRSCRHAHD